MLNPHLEELSQRHRDLERKIEEEMAHPSSDHLKVSELKRAKLRLKEKIAHLESGIQH